MSFWIIKHTESGRIASQKEIEQIYGLPFIGTKDYVSLVYESFPEGWEMVEYPPGDEPPSSMLDVPYLSQWGDGANKRSGDCGPASAAMIVHFLTGQRPTVDQMADACGQPATGEGSKYTNHAQLQQGAKKYGVRLETRSPYTENHGLPRLSTLLISQQINAGKPCIALVHYGVLREETDKHPLIVHNQDRNFSRGHWVVVVGYNDQYAHIHDPNFWEARSLDGKDRAVPTSAFEKALKAIAPGNTVAEQGLIVV